MNDMTRRSFGLVRGCQIHWSEPVCSIRPTESCTSGRTSSVSTSVFLPCQNMLVSGATPRTRGLLRRKRTARTVTTVSSPGTMSKR